jgi:hypothetical protein
MTIGFKITYFWAIVKLKGLSLKHPHFTYVKYMELASSRICLAKNCNPAYPATEFL